MYIENIVVSNFRCLKNMRFNFDKSFNLLYGDNAQGKTSVLEAIYFIASGKSFITKKILEQIKNGESKLTVFAKTDDSSYAVELSKESRNFYIDKNKVKYTQYIGNIPIISFTPEDIEIILGSPDIRRRFFNYEISQIDKSYLLILLNFQRVLKQRNALLKSKNIDNEVFKLYTEKFIDYSIKLSKKRKDYVYKISELITKKYSQLFDNKKEIEIIYETSISDYLNKDDFRVQLEKRKEKELLYGYSLIGPHKDDFSFLINKKKVKSFASQGEKKSVLFALKISQSEYIYEKKNISPIFILDDITAYFDEFRKEKLLNYLKTRKIQCFISSTAKLDIEAKMIKINKGESVDD